MPRILRLALLFLFLPGAALAADLKITDTSGAQVVVKDAAIDYSGALGSFVRESSGIRLQVGEATVTVKWKDIQSLTVVRRENAATARFDVDVVRRNGQRASAVLPRPQDVKLRGRTDLGDYTIDLDKVRSIEPLR